MLDAPDDAVIGRFLSKVNVVDDACWLWEGATLQGYGAVTIRQRTYRAPRVSYEMFVGPIPDGFEVDHLCRVPGCVNPDHLEAVTPAENKRRAAPFSAKANRTHCKKEGHPLSGNNLYVKKNGTRQCRACQREAMRRFKARRKAVA